MNNFNDYNGYQQYSTDFTERRETVVQEVVRKTYLYMFFALIISGLFAYVAYSTGKAEEMIADGTFFILFIAELAIVIVANILLKKNNATVSAVMLAIYSIINGMTMSIIFLVYQMQSIVAIFFVTAGIFGCMALYGHTTNKDLTSLGNLLIMALLGMVLMTLVNIIVLKSQGLDLALAYVGVAIFVGLIAYDAQKIKKLAESNSYLSTDSMALWGALNLYLDFINLFLKLLRLFAKRN